MTPRQQALLPSEWPEYEPPAKLPKTSSAEELFAEQCRSYRLPAFERQFVFAKSIGRRWRFDFCFPAYWLAVEIDGVAVKRLAGQLVVLGRHASIEGIASDHEKCNCAVLLGWSLLHFLQKEVKPRRAIETTLRVLAAKGWRTTS